MWSTIAFFFLTACLCAASSIAFQSGRRTTGAVTAFFALYVTYAFFSYEAFPAFHFPLG
jgi:hypothetical protein